MVSLCAVFSGAHSAFAQSASASVVSENVALVGGVPVPRARLDRALEGAYGSLLLTQLIDNQLISNALNARGLRVSEVEVDAETARRQQQNFRVRFAISEGAYSKEAVRDQVRRELGIQKLITSRAASPTEAQLKKFFAAYFSYYATPPRNRLALLTTVSKARADQLMRALKANPNSFNTFVSRQKARAAKEVIAGQSTSDAGKFEAPTDFFTSRGVPRGVDPPLLELLTTAKKGQILPIQTATPRGPFLILKIVDRQEALKPSYEKFKVQIETDYKLVQLTQIEIKKNPANPQDLKQIVNDIINTLSDSPLETDESTPRARLRDALTLILKSVVNNSMKYLRLHSKVVILDSSLKEVKREEQEQ